MERNADIVYLAGVQTTNANAASSVAFNQRLVATSAEDELSEQYGKTER